MFIDQNDTIDITIYCKKKDNHYNVCDKKTFEKMKEGEDKLLYKPFLIKTKPLTWGASNELQESAIIRNLDGDRFWNFKLFKENKLKRIIVSWDAKRKNKNGEEELVPVSPEAIMSLAPEVAETILTAYDFLTTTETETEVEVDNKDNKEKKEKK